ncbi:uncharacterized protein LOC8044022 isoform X2 [Ixodes scapularis]|uniref:uncharacterized protein LOC8044022 isoform X2 n=1 Tax=Ixodes scapularis TaxID=6945 RepID=UPI001C382B22|nr:uncharacterized protein LOC8044022 isoform X2 [Ixodes scapularis]
MPGRYCSAKWCNNSSRPSTLTDKSFHLFPQDSRYPKWVAYANLQKDTPTKRAKGRFLCSDHFEDSAFFSLSGGKRRLLRNAVPSVPVTNPRLRQLVPPEFFCSSGSASKPDEVATTARAVPPGPPEVSAVTPESLGVLPEEAQAAPTEVAAVDSKASSVVPGVSTVTSEIPVVAPNLPAVSTNAEVVSPGVPSTALIMLTVPREVPTTSLEVSTAVPDVSAATPGAPNAVPETRAKVRTKLVSVRNSETPGEKTMRRKRPRDRSVGNPSVLSEGMLRSVLASNPSNSSSSSSAASDDDIALITDFDGPGEPCEPDPIPPSTPSQSDSQLSSQDSQELPPVARSRRLKRLQTSRPRTLLNAYRSQKNLRSCEISRAELVKYASRFLSKQGLEMFRVELYLNPLRGYRKKWPSHLTACVSSLFFLGPTAYMNLSKLLSIPPVRVLRDSFRSMDLEPGVVPEILEALQKKMAHWSLEDCTCVLHFDEIPLTESLCYDFKRDKVIGFEDIGTKRSDKVANTALVVTISGLSKRWTQPIAFVLSRTKIDVAALEKLLLTLIEELQPAGVLVKAVVCDQGGCNWDLSRKLGVTLKEPFFIVKGERVYFLFDVPHLLRCTRNNLRNVSALRIGEHTVRWSHMQSLYELPHPLRGRLLRRITDRHIYQSLHGNKVTKFAAQVFSGTMSLAILVFVSLLQLDPDAAQTATFCDRMDQLFDVLNSKTVSPSKPGSFGFALSADPDPKKARKCQDQLDFLKSTASWISQWKFDSKHPPNTIRGWQLTITAVLWLWNDLCQNFGFKQLFTRRLSLERLGAFLRKCRQQHWSKDTPTASQFIVAFKSILVDELFVIPGRSDGEADISVLLAELKRVPVSSAARMDSEEQSEDPLYDTGITTEVQSGDHHQLVQANVRYVFAGRIVHLFQNRFPCGTCCPNLMSRDHKSTSEHRLLESLSTQIFGEHSSGVTVPASSCFQFVVGLEEYFGKYVAIVLELENVSKQLCTHLMRVPDNLFCSPVCKGVFVGLFSRLRLHWHLRLMNAMLRELPASRERRNPK